MRQGLSSALSIGEADKRRGVRRCFRRRRFYNPQTTAGVVESDDTVHILALFVTIILFVASNYD